MQYYKVMWMTYHISADTSTWKPFPVTSLRLDIFTDYFAIKIICIFIHLYWVLHLSIGRYVRGCTNSTCGQISFPSILLPCPEDLCSRVTIILLTFLIRKVRGRKDSICLQLCIPILVYASLFKVISFIMNSIILPL